MLDDGPLQTDTLAASLLIDAVDPPDDGTTVDGAAGDGATVAAPADVAPASTVIDTAGPTHLTQVADAYFLLDGANAGPALNAGGIAVTDGLFGDWAPLAAETGGSGYYVAWRLGSTDVYTVWATNAAGSYLGDIGAVSGASYAFTAWENVFHQDLNGDSIVGPPTTVIDSTGATRLTQMADTYFLLDGADAGPALNVGGVAVTDGLFGDWTPLAAEIGGSVVYVAWRLGSTDVYTVWGTNAAGAYLGDIGAVSGGSYAFTAWENVFQQDLNGDSMIGPPTTVIESTGATHLTQVGDAYFLLNGANAGPALTVGGAAVSDGQFGDWTPVAAEAGGGGYYVAWRLGSTDVYTVWGTNAAGAYLGDIGAVSGGSYAFTAWENVFHQDLNGDSIVGPSTTVLDSAGAIHLTQVGDVYFLFNGANVGPALTVGGAAVTDGQFGSWTPIAAEAMVGGYRVAWQLAGTDTYTVWKTDAGGGYVGDIGAVAGTSVALRSLEPSLGQDLNRDGQVASVTTIESVGSLALVQTLGTYFLGSVAGPQLSVGTVAAVFGQFGSWAPIGAEASGGGYVVAWKQGSDEYTVWTTNGAGAYLADTGVLSGSSTTLRQLETTLRQDLNGDGTIGLGTFNITISYSGSSAYQSYFTAAAQRWERVIAADIPDVVSALWGAIDDLLISASVTSIDGVGGILGQAGPDEVRTSSLLPSHGVMRFDSADLASMANSGILTDVITHEMGHVLGFGTLWSAMGLRSGYNYIGTGGIEAFRILSGNAGAGSVPLETGGGSGTAGVHWSDSVFGNEIMTGYIGSAPNPLSILTVGALRDLGYAVNYAAADSYTMPGHASSSGTLQTSSGGTTPIISGSGGTTLSGSVLSGTPYASLSGRGTAGPAWYGLVGGIAETIPFAWIGDDEEDDALPLRA
ncbi:leishmanolysin-related zinc metalloendopeptidase [Reyranella sp.]|uniref:leishmanolysin-related zinc metalloendopeptidase n=1 Tax=Reyranella sp. TaxID=1929291 RepID=UPI003BAA12E3